MRFLEGRTSLRSGGRVVGDFGVAARGGRLNNPRCANSSLAMGLHGRDDHAPLFCSASIFLHGQKSSWLLEIGAVAPDPGERARPRLHRHASSRGASASLCFSLSHRISLVSGRAPQFANRWNRATAPWFQKRGPTGLQPDRSCGLAGRRARRAALPTAGWSGLWVCGCSVRQIVDRCCRRYQRFPRASPWSW